VVLSLVRLSVYSAVQLQVHFEVEEMPTLIATREVREHGNVFHAFTDMMNVYIALRVMRWQGKRRQVSYSRVQVSCSACRTD
jgi:hypothetical protein